MEDNIKLDLRE